MNNIFEKEAESWWDPEGPFKLLHKMNPLRLDYLLRELPEEKNHLKALDFGCGGGLITIPLANLGMKVTGLDSCKKTIEKAEEKSNKLGVKVEYFTSDLKNFNDTKKKFDLITAFEVLEHLEDYKLSLVRLATLLKPGGILVISTINKTPLSYLGAIFLAEKILGWVPPGTHDWNHFIKPSDLVEAASAASLELLDLSGLTLNPFTQNWFWSETVSINYFMTFRKKH
jgi:2-polyprenyl-6-hydroxyphenyl methylase/3-demethylubiquinone-9 3-methyltransferase